MARKSSKLFLWLLPLLGIIGLLFLALRKRPNQEPQEAIRRALNGYPQNVIEYWTAVSAHETNGWTSKVYREGNNLFGMTLASRDTTAIGKLPYGEGQAIYRSVEDSARDIRLYMEKRFNYPVNFSSLAELVAYMKSKRYFEDSTLNYLAGADAWYRKLYNKKSFA